jgi:cytochrome c oxidase subunit 2
MLLFSQIDLSPALPISPVRASTIGEDVDYLFYYISAWTVGAYILVTALMLYFIARYRKRPGGKTPRILGSHRLELVWTITPLLVFLTFFAWGAVVYNKLFHPPPDAPEVYVVGKQWMWKIQHPGGQREINELHVPIGKPFKLTMTSEDVIHSFGIPAFRCKVDVVPGRYTYAWFTPTKVGKFHLFCDQLCGVGHSQMVGSVTVMEQAEYEDWLKSRAEGSLALEGRKLFFKLQCIECHSNNPRARAPVLEGIYGQKVPLEGGGEATVDDGYIRESILKPRAKIHQGWQPIMPTFQGQVSEEDLIKVIAFIKSLRPGETPKRNEEFPAPVGAPVDPAKRSEESSSKSSEGGSSKQ